jgi:uncharacterized membrane protein (DUF485 family)
MATRLSRAGGNPDGAPPVLDSRLRGNDGSGQGMIHQPSHSNSDLPSASHTRLGHVLFLLYLVCYMAFVLANAFAVDWIERTLVLGVNVAVVGGLGLIVLALLLAVIYDWCCRSLRTGDTRR